MLSLKKNTRFLKLYPDGTDFFAKYKGSKKFKREILTQPILRFEIRRIMKELKVNSAPGLLGLSNNIMKEIMPHVLVDLGNKMGFLTLKHSYFTGQ